MSLLALDIGGANLKAALTVHAADGAVRRLDARSLPFALWREPDVLPGKLAELVARFPRRDAGAIDALAVTMTAELCDCFASRREGVARVLDMVTRFAAGRPVKVWLTAGRFASVKEARRRWLAAASSNWHALATWLARQFAGDTSLLIDIGSTTTDITLLRDGKADASLRDAEPRAASTSLTTSQAHSVSDRVAERRGYFHTDAARLARVELVYLGVFRTPLMAIPLLNGNGERVETMAERFATAADLFVLTGDQPAQPRCMDTADGRPLTRQACANRVLRMVGSDAGIEGRHAMAKATALARDYVAAMESIIASSVRMVMQHGMSLGRGGKLKRVIVAGSGEFLAARAVERELPGVEMVSLQEVVGRQASTAACAVALAHLHGLQPLRSNGPSRRVRQGSAQTHHR